MRMSKAPLDKLLLLLAVVMSLSIQSLVLSEEEVNRSDFVVESSVFLGEKKKPLQETMTVFHGSRAYDRTAGVAKLAVFDFDERVVFLADEKQKRRTHISFENLLRCQANINQRALTHGGFAAFLASPKFIIEHEFHKTQSTITLSSPWLTYSATGKQSAADVVERLLEFADWSARLGNLESRIPYPAQARIELNKVLKAKNWQVTQVTRTPGPRIPKLPPLRCERKYAMELGARELDFIREAENALKKFRAVEFSDYVSDENSNRVAAKR